MKRTLTRAELGTLTAKHGFKSCTHPECGGKGEGFCASDYFYRRAVRLAKEAFAAGRRSVLHGR